MVPRQSGLLFREDRAQALATSMDGDLHGRHRGFENLRDRLVFQGRGNLGDPCFAAGRTII